MGRVSDMILSIEELETAGYAPDAIAALVSAEYQINIDENYVLGVLRELDVSSRNDDYSAHYGLDEEEEEQ